MSLQRGDRFGSRTVLREGNGYVAADGKMGPRRYWVECDCGKRALCTATQLRRTRGCRQCSRRNQFTGPRDDIRMAVDAHRPRVPEPVLRALEKAGLA